MICVALKDGKIRIAQIGKPFFPEPLNEKIFVIKENEELFLTGSYPDHNTILLNFEKYKSFQKEFQQHCPSTFFWKISTFSLLFISMFLSIFCLHYSGFFSQAWKFVKEKK